MAKDEKKSAAKVDIPEGKKVKVEKKIILKKDELIDRIAQETGCTKTDTAKIVDTYPKVVLQALKDAPPADKEHVSAITLPGFGVMSNRYKEAYERTDNRTGEKVTIQAHYVPTIKVSKTFKVELNSVFFEGKKQEAEAKKGGKKKSA